MHRPYTARNNNHTESQTVVGTHARGGRRGAPSLPQKMKTCLRQCSSWAWRLEKAPGTGDWQKYASSARELFGLLRAAALFQNKAGRPCVWAARSKIHQSCLARDKAVLRAQQFRDGAIKINGRFARRTMVFWRAFSCSILHCSDTGEKVHLLVRHRNRPAKARYDMSASHRVCKVYWLLHLLFRAASYFLISADGEIPVPFPSIPSGLPDAAKRYTNRNIVTSPSSS